ncbi:MAG: hypothetical protein ACXVZT_00560 [Terriglobales bacterium]
MRYILELGEHERGGACGCECVGCHQPLIAVNAAKTEWSRRPHFRHESGSETHGCHVLSARAALLASLQEGDLIVLPRLRRSVTVHGLSGAAYVGWFEVAPQAVRIGQVHFTDATTAEIVLEDGRRLQVVVVGSASVEDGGEEVLVPRIEICSDDPSLAEMSPEDLRARLVPAIETARWCGFWANPAGDAEALRAAEEAAGQALDWDDEASDLPTDLRRESLLHREVKSILEEASSVLLPGWLVSASGAIATDRDRIERVKLAGARLEQKLGRIIPDVIAQLQLGGELLVEVTVTNTITSERLERIREVNLATIEIDFSRMAGMLSRDALRDLVLNDVAGKVWLHHPALSRMVGAAAGDMLHFGSRRSGDPGEWRQQLVATPAEEYAQRYLAAVRELARIEYEGDPDQLSDREQEKEYALSQVRSAADGLHAHGYPEALDERLYHRQRTMLHRLMSIMTGLPVAYRYKQAGQVINSMHADVTAEAKSWHALYLLAIEVRGQQLTLTLAQTSKLDSWRDEVRSSLQRSEDTYRRDPRYDRLLALLFPELVPGLDYARLKRPAAGVAEPVEVDPDTVDERYFHEPGSEHWVWAFPSAARDYQLEVLASRARLDGWTVDETSILYHVLHAKRLAGFVSTCAVIAAEKARVEPASVLRFLCRNGFIVLEKRGESAV